MIASKEIAKNPILLSLPPYGLVKNDKFESELRQKGLEIFDFTLGDPKEPTPDFIKQSLIDNVTDVSQYPSASGMLDLRTAAASWLQRRFGTTLSPKTQIISSNGSKEAVFLVPQIFLNCTTHQNVIVLPEPGYPIHKYGTILAGGELCEIPLKESKNFVLDVDDIPADLLPKIAAIWISYPHNPTGAIINEKEAKKIYEWALKHNIVLLSDECYVDIYFEGGEPPLSFLQIAQKENYKNLLCFYTLSKRSGMTGYRTGFIAGDENLVSLFAKFRLSAGVGTPDFIQRAAITAWNDDSHVQARNSIFSEKRQLIEAFLIKNKIEFLKSNSTIYIWATIPSPFECSYKFCDFLANKTGVLATAGEIFGPSCKKYFRLALVPTVSELKKALSVWQKSLDEGLFA